MKISSLLVNSTLVLLFPIVLIVGVVGWLVFGAVGVAVKRNADDIAERVEVQKEAQKKAAELAAKAAQPLPLIEGKSFEAVVADHGQPMKKDKDTGWASWDWFEAKFHGGKVIQVARMDPLEVSR